jgi:hypothetical protein
MVTPNFDDIRDTPLTTDEQLVPFLQALLEGAYRRQVWLVLLDADSKPLPVVMPSAVQAEPDGEDITGFADFMRCAAYDVAGSILVVTFERPGPAQIVDRDRRWLKLLRAACVETGVGFRGPFLLLGNEVRQVAPDEYADADLKWSEDEEDDEDDDEDDDDRE